MLHGQTTKAFIAEGFGSWNKALERFDMHEKSEMHCEAVERLAYKSSRVHIGNIMNAQSLYEQEFHRSMLIKLMRAVKYLGKQGFPLSGHMKVLKYVREIYISFYCQYKQKNVPA